MSASKQGKGAGPKQRPGPNKSSTQRPKQGANKAPLAQKNSSAAKVSLDERVAKGSAVIGVESTGPVSTRSGGKPQAAPTIVDARFVGGAEQLADLPAPVHREVAFGGRSNVGKSSLMNMLLARKKLVRTSSTPGATRALNVFAADLLRDGERGPLGLVDLPGYGFAHRSKQERARWGPMIEQYLSMRPNLGRVVVVVDARRGVGDEDLELIEYLEHIGRPAAIAMTKVDKLSRSERTVAQRTYAGTSDVPLVWVSAETSEGRDALWALLLSSP